jgi:hypothetical protein
MKPRTLSVTTMILLTPMLVLAFQTQGDQVRKNELKGSPFITGSLKITITKLGHAFTFSNTLQNSSIYIYPIQVQVENTSDEFTTFEPRRLSFVDKANRQSDIHGLIPYDDERWRGASLLSAAENRRIAPKTSIKNWYDLTSQVHLPARLYYAEMASAKLIFQFLTKMTSESFFRQV